MLGQPVVVTHLVQFARHVAHPVLLRTQNGAWAHDADPAGEGLRLKIVVLHGVGANQAASAAQSRLAVHRHHSICLCLSQRDELLHDAFRWAAAVREEEVGVLDAFAQEPLSVLRLCVQSDDMRHLIGIELRDVMLRRQSAPIE